MFHRRGLIFLLGFGVIAGYGSGIASLAHHARCGGGGCESHWGRFHQGPPGFGGRYADERWNDERPVDTRAAPAPTPAPQTVVVAPAPAPAAPAPQIFVIMPGATPQPVMPQVVVQPATPHAVAP